MRELRFGFIMAFWVLALFMASQSAFSSSEAGRKPASNPSPAAPPTVLEQNQASGFRECRFNCQYGQGNEVLSQAVLYSKSKLSAVEEKLRELRALNEKEDKDESRISSLRFEITLALPGICKAGESSSVEGVGACVDRFKNFNSMTLRKNRLSMIENSNAIRLLNTDQKSGVPQWMPPESEVSQLKVQAPEMRSLEKTAKDYQAQVKAWNENLPKEYTQYVDQLGFAPSKTDFVLWKKEEEAKPDEVEYRLEMASSCEKVEKSNADQKCKCDKNANGESVCYDENAYSKAMSKFTASKDKTKADQDALKSKADDQMLPEKLDSGAVGSLSYQAYDSSRTSVIYSVNEVLLQKKSKSKDDKTSSSTAGIKAPPPGSGVPTDRILKEKIPYGSDGAGTSIIRGDIHVRYDQNDLDQLASE